MGNRLSRFFGMAALFVAACGSDDTGGTAADSGATGKDGSTLPSCDSLCPAVLAPHCAQGPVSQSDCVGGCESIRASKCADKYLALYECGGAQAVYACDSEGRTVVIGCESASAALYACAMS
jgi:hypothetical protein